MIVRRYLIAALAATLGLGSSPALAGEVFGGVFAHDAHLPIDLSGEERGSIDFNLGWRGDRIGALDAIGAPSPYAYVLANTAGKTSVAAAGVSWRIGRQVYVRPGIGIAVHSSPDNDRPDRINFGSRIVFAPEMSAGVRLNQSMSIEATVLHFSHAQIFSRQNPGMDDVGLRLNVAF